MELAEFAIYPVAVGAGQIALSAIPGRYGTYEDNLSAILHWGPDLVLTMTGQAELDRVGATDFGADLSAAGVAWRHLPIVDFGAPNADVIALWPETSALAHDVLAQGCKILSHCFGGCGRSGMVALRLMIETGEAPDAALARLRAVRPCAVERDAQFEWASNGV
ncbi:dual specificity protein phosphatase family protein [Octadecabacter sp. 1_MG-2023]|uniref:phosphatase domain-containing putative toxin n=1 Tax=unclassified Octadecabacter TaxID=196158 RepID=UPI001C0A1453|nr:MULTISPECIES: dual specificity protein phosphatase family protein [unclassified Octadecabacter]MBU2994231.1 dual specificity protein phosphatase family protein [Octadecabacter sp. B2R22]MDO6734480.1 dual specificity protein phosphatase family protein [Octadecabacter sp. 1_MG-2023]